MKEIGMLFKAPMVRALLEGRKTQTRRIAKPVRHPDLGNVYSPGALVLEHEPQHVINRACPYGQPGDRIYVRETWNWFDPQAIPAERAGQRAPFTGCQGSGQIPWVAAYAADGPLPYPGYYDKEHWRPSIHMPKWAARIWLEVTGVRVERLQDISNEDAIAEGVNRISHGREGDYYSAIRNEQHQKNWTYPDDAFRELWESTGGDWAANPWVWVVDFKVLSTTGRPV